jgi:ferredoxin
MKSPKILPLCLMSDTQDKIVEIGKYKVQVIRDLCIGAASCIAFSPSVFELDGEQKAIILDAAMDTEENLLLAAQSCPTKAIIITDKDTGEQVWPN